MKSTIKLSIFFIATALLSSGCATYSEVSPTIEEMHAVSPHKKKVAVMELSDKGSEVRGVGQIATAALEALLYRQFNLIERQQIESVLNERNFIVYENGENVAELGKALNVDYLVFGNAVATVSEPSLEHSARTDKKGRFQGSIWHEQVIQSHVSIKMVEVATGAVVFADDRSSNLTQEVDRKYFDNEEEFNKDMKSARHSDDRWDAWWHGQKRAMVDPMMLRKIFDETVLGFRGRLTQQFPHQGQILDKISESEVLVNLGSAYDVKPGDRLVAYNANQGSFQMDPNTGLGMKYNTQRVFLTVHHVTSGITCIAKGNKDKVSGLEIGAVVSTVGRARGE